MYGFLLCFMSTSVATVYHYLLGNPAPYPLLSLPKLFGLLLLVGVTGLLLYFCKGTVAAGGLLIVHLAVVAAFFVALPYSKMSHGFFRLAALCREVQVQRDGG